MIELLHDPDSMSTGTNGLIPPETGIFMGFDLAGRLTVLPEPISTDSVSIEVRGDLESKRSVSIPLIRALRRLLYSPTRRIVRLEHELWSHP